MLGVLAAEDAIGQEKLIRPCVGLSETDCFKKLSGCIEVASLSDYMYKKGFRINLKGWPDDFTGEMKSPIPTNFPSAKILRNIQLMGGGDYGTFSFIKLGNTYCELTPENMKKVFAPMKNKEDALKYYLFVKYEMGSAWANSIVNILKDEDYNNETIKSSTDNCRDFRERIQSRITSVNDVEDGYIITLISFNYMGRINFFETKVKINFDATITEISEKTILDCGEGFLF